MNSFAILFDILIAIAGIYMFFWAVTGNGPLYKAENIKENLKNKYHKLIKWFCLFGGLTAIAAGILDYMKIEPAATISFAALCVIVFFVFAVIVLFTDSKRVGHKKVAKK